MDVIRRQATEVDRTFVREANARAYESVVIRQFGEWDEGFQEGLFNEKWRRAAFEVLELAGRPVGALWASDEGDHRFLHEVFLLPAYQGRGIGSQLVGQELAVARVLGKPLRLRVLRESRARALYERLGFAVYDETETHYLMEAV